MELSSIIGLIAAFFTTFSFAPQAIKTIKTKNTDGLSKLMYSMFITGVMSWIIYGYLIKDLAVLLANIVTFFLALPIFVILIKGNKSL